MSAILNPVQILDVYTLIKLMKILIKKLYAIFFSIFTFIYIWKTRMENSRIEILKLMIVNKVSKHFYFLKLLPNVKLEKVFEGISRLDNADLINV